MPPKVEDISGVQFGKLNVVSLSETMTGYGRHLWICSCSCGGSSLVTATHLKTGATTSCGCSRDENNKTMHNKHNAFDVSGEFGIGYAKNGIFYFDLNDYELIKNNYWSITNENYVIMRMNINHNRVLYSLHRTILKLNKEDKVLVDHINRNPLDNRKINLRIANNSQNTHNSKLRSDNFSGITGVNWSCQNNRWIVQLKSEKTSYIGSFINFEDAIIARLKAEKEYLGEFSPQQHLFEKYNI